VHQHRLLLPALLAVCLTVAAAVTGPVPAPAVAGALSLPAPGLAAAPDVARCRPDVFEGARYTVCSYDLRTSEVRVFSAGPDGAPYRTFAALSRGLAGSAGTAGSGGLSLAFAINGGMFQEDWSPVGLLVENGVQRHPVNRATTRVRPTPNFYKQPNGVFFIAKGKAGILTTDRYVKDKPKVDFATQSGPMLVIDGKLHPAFRAGSTERTRRSGVGVVNDATVVFAISEDWVNFDQFARLFRDRLKAKNALFLDGGTAPGIYAPELGRNDPPGHGGYGPMIAVVRKAT
jgi:uncharacterized protein YigE (DUF2233 family)